MIPARPWLTATVVMMVIGAAAAKGQAGSGALDGLPLTERAATTGTRLALIITGDGGWVSGDRAIADVLVDHGIGVVGLDSRAYLRGGTRTPDGIARDVERILDHYREAWGRDSLLLVGYSRGADLLPFAVSRLPDSLRRRVVLVALVSLAKRASFEFHWSDLVRDVPRPTDMPLAAEVAKLGGLRILCIGGVEEKSSGCNDLDPTRVRVTVHAGGHALTSGSGGDIGRMVLRELDAPRVLTPGKSR